MSNSKFNLFYFQCCESINDSDADLKNDEYYGKIIKFFKKSESSRIEIKSDSFEEAVKSFSAIYPNQSVRIIVGYGSGWLDSPLVCKNPNYPGSCDKIEIINYTFVDSFIFCTLFLSNLYLFLVEFSRGVD